MNSELRDRTLNIGARYPKLYEHLMKLSKSELKLIASTINNFEQS